MTKPIDVTMQALQDLLDSGMSVGEQLPNEATLATEFGVSRATIREAVSRLAVAGRLEKRWGVGTFVTEPKPASGFSLLTFHPGIVASLAATGGVVSAPFGSIEVGPPDPETFPDFPDSATATLHRVYAVDGQPAIFIRDLMITQNMGDEIDFDDTDWMTLLIPDLYEQIGLKFAELSMELSAHMPGVEEQERLDVPGTEPILVSSGRAVDGEGRTLLTVRSCIRTSVVQPSVASSLATLAQSSVL